MKTMTLPQRHRRNITCAGRAYYWYFPQGRDWDHRSNYHLIVQPVEGDGQVLKVFQPSWPDVTPSFVAAVISEGLDAGWRPDEQAAPFTLTRSAEA